MTSSTQNGGSTGDLSSKLLPELRSIGTQMGIKGARTMRKADLVAAIRAGGFVQASARTAERGESRPRRRAHQTGGAPASQEAPASAEAPRTRRQEELPAEARQDRAEPAKASDEQPGDQDHESARRQDPNRNRRRRNQPRHNGDDGGAERPSGQVNDEVGARLEALSHQAGHQGGGENRRTDARTDTRQEDLPESGSDDDYGNGRRSRRRRQRDRQNRRNKRGSERVSGNESDPNVREDDVLVPCSGILDIRDQYAFVRTSGYLPGPNDAYVSMNMVRKHGLRRGDVVTGALRAKREGERREKFAPLVRLDTVNGADPEQMRTRAEFSRLTPLYPQERLRLETDAKNMTGRIIDLVSPIGKGQRGLIVSPPKAGKTMIMQSIANSITQNNPEVHLMVVLVDERPEEVTDFQRTVSGEVIASTFDRPADDHTQLSELAIERAKRLVELGHDVVILLDGITRLGRAYNLAAPASGRILSGGVDSAALYPPKKFFGAARNIENGGSLTILATALVETGSKMDEVIFEEFKGTGNSELRLRREFANKRLFPAIDVDASGTRREELLLSREETAIMWKLRRVLSGLDGSQALEMMLSKLRKTQTNTEFLFTISKTTPSAD
ncbi:transcription termination factor Rho [Acidipropionibacterium virtanenii]|uniref:Transcription termination factor Rho n=1 Tax=Acidipropionibacterium virtanenii TaxID=2057246 RepID=A0A344UTS7_9ACTN|nr:transcription termination factor Rho [Acidipropionibacterium virtanenii]AXE38675.1 Transcription termination factor Rho [Acidipropionibacterium virtanenii]